jgi:uncharacterized protein (TIGR01370 family)
MVAGATAAVAIVVTAAALVMHVVGPSADVVARPPIGERSSAVPGSTPSSTASEPDSTTADPSTATAPSSSAGPGEATGPGASPTTAAGAATAAIKGRLGSVSTWSFAIGVDVDDEGTRSLATRLAGYDLVVLDGAEAQPALVAALHAQGAIVLGYVSVGTIEQNRSWSAAAEPYLLDHWSEWDENYADTSQPGYRDLIVDTVVPPMLAKGFDGLFLDNTDMVDTHPAQQAGMVEIVRRLSEAVHARGGVLFAQNGDTTVDTIAPFLDGWNREDLSSTYDADARHYTPRTAVERDAGVATIARLRDRGLLVTAVDYTADARGSAVDDARRTACAAGAVPYVSDIGLTRIPDTPPRC